MRLPPPRSTLFPYTTLFRSEIALDGFAQVREQQLFTLDRDRARFDLGQVEDVADERSEEHTSELQSLTNLVCRLLLEKKNKNNQNSYKHKDHHEQHHLATIS